jgi:hypothetical protein
MPSMSYCMFENTSIELSQCVDAMENANDIEDLDFSSYEQDAFREMYVLCKAYINEYERIAVEFMEV